MFWYLIACLVFNSNVSGSELTDIVDTKYGPVQGSKIPLHTGQTINSFLGIPFAKPPIGELRFKSPEEPDPWEDVMSATSLRSACMQSLASGILWVTHPGWTDQDEDCLHLNIYTPEDMSDRPYPVMVWIHGGGYQAGANIKYPGHFLAAKDVIVVVLNYRLGHLGFATTGNDLIPGNAGMMDQVLALRFVQENIEAFGGNPDQVTIFGQSAGGASVGLHVVSPLSAGLFQQAILQSGTELQIWAVNEPAQEPENYIVQVAEDVGCDTENQEQMVECLRSRTARRIINANVNCTTGYLCLGMAPVVDGQFLPEMPVEIRRKGEHNKVPEMVGITKEDGYLIVPVVSPASIIRGLNRSEFETVIENIVDYFTPVYAREDRWEDIYQALVFFYTDWSQVNDPDTNRAMLGDIVTDGGFLLGSDLQAKDQAHDAATYFYVYGHTTDESLVPEWMHAYHSIENSYVFGIPFVDLNDAVRNDSANIRTGNFTEEEQQFSDYIMTLWSNFAKYGNPTQETTIPPGSDEAVLWPTFGADDYKYMYLDRQVFVGEKYRQEYAAFWREYMNWLVFDNKPNRTPNQIDDISSFGSLFQEVWDLLK